MRDVGSPLVLVSDPLFERARVVRGLDEHGARVDTLPDGTTGRAAELLADAAAMIVSPETRLTAEQVALATRLEAVVSPVIGVDHIALDALADRRVVVAHGAAPENFAGMAEAVIGLLVALARRFTHKQSLLLHGVHRIEHPGHLLMGKTVGLVGAGRIGRAVIERLRGWQCRIVVADPQLTPQDAAALGGEVSNLDDLLAASDFVTVQVPLTEGTRGMLDRSRLSRMKRGAYLVNISRGGIVDEAALADLLRGGHLTAAAVDAWEQEPPPPSHPLLALGDRVIVTGHNVGHTIDAYHRLADLAVEQVMRALGGRPVVYPLSPPVERSSSIAGD